MRSKKTQAGAQSHGFCFGMPFLLETKTVDDALNLATSLGLSFIELNTNFPNSMVMNLDADYLKKEAGGRGIFYTLHLDDAMSIADFNPFVRKAYLETALEAIDFAKKLGIPTINIHFAKGNIVTLPDGKHFLFSYYKEEFHNNLREFRDACQERIGDADLMIAVENTDGWDDYEREAIEILLESPAFGLTLDIGHNHAVNDRDLDYFYDHKDRLIHMHGHDGWDKTNHQALGTGEIPLKDRFEFAKSQEATVVLETKTIEALKKSVEWLKKNGMI